ncbi:MAG: hypothetical protein KBC16_02165 [Candidatus Pacebacteria bacterium]|nr:hypothetical protein [Candidatus Paceibacterota bacterium]
MPIWLWVFIAVLVLCGTGALTKLLIDRIKGPEEVTWKEWMVASTVITLFVAPLTAWSGTALAKKDNVTFREFWNGWEADVRVEETICHRDGSCNHHYNCDPYIVQVPYSCGDSKHPRTCYRSETRYHSCPWVDAEYAYIVETTLGPYTIDHGRFPENPQSHRYRSRRIPQSVIESAGVGEPEFWSRAKLRLRQGNPWPVTQVHSYNNFVLASDYTILRRYREAAEEYRALRLLPPITSSIRDGFFYRSEKVHAIGCPRGTQERWNEYVEKLNAAFGSELQGDVRLVLSCNARINANPDRYRFALEAHWQNKELFKKTALPKNTLVIIVGSDDGRVVSYARAFTGMPTGNKALVIALASRLRAVHTVPFTPEAVVGTVTGRPAQAGGRYRATSVRAPGVFTDVLWGVSNRQTRFSRVSMEAKDENDVGSGFSYLKGEVQLTTGQKVLILFFVILLSVAAFAVIAFNDWFNAKGDSNRWNS